MFKKLLLTIVLCLLVTQVALACPKPPPSPTPPPPPPTQPPPSQPPSGGGKQQEEIIKTPTPIPPPCVYVIYVFLENRDGQIYRDWLSNFGIITKEKLLTKSEILGAGKASWPSVEPFNRCTFVFSFQKDEETASHLWVASTNGAEFLVRQITFGDQSQIQPDWSFRPEGWIYYTENGSVKAVNAWGRSGNFEVSGSQPSSSLDGKYVAVVDGGVINVFDNEGKPVTSIPHTGQKLTWAPDGTNLSYAREGKIFKFDFSSGTEILLWDGEGVAFDPRLIAKGDVFSDGATLWWDPTEGSVRELTVLNGAFSKRIEPTWRYDRAMSVSVDMTPFESYAKSHPAQ